MNINWILRLKNKATLMALIVVVISAVYNVLAVLGITPDITQESVLNVIGIVVSILAALGIVVDPTTSGVSDSSKAMSYTEPNKD